MLPRSGAVYGPGDGVGAIGSLAVVPLVREKRVLGAVVVIAANPDPHLQADVRNVSLFAASQHPERVKGLVLEMPVLEWAVTSAALIFSPMLLLAHYARSPLRWLGSALSHLPSTPFDPLNSIIHAGTQSPDVMAAVLHGVLVGPVAPTVEARKSITAPTLVLAHRHDLIHPFNDADNLARQLQDVRLVPAHSPLELRMRPGRLTEEISGFLDQVSKPEGRARTTRPTKRKAG